MATTSGSMWPLTTCVHRRQMGEAGRAQLQAERLVGAIGNQVAAELALGRLDRGVGFAGRHAIALA